MLSLLFLISDLALYNSHLVKKMREKFQKRKMSAFSSNLVLLYISVLLALQIIIMCKDIIDLKYCFPGRLTITEFVLLSLVMLEDSGMLDTYVGEILNKTKKRHDTSAVDELEPRGTFSHMIP